MPIQPHHRPVAAPLVAGLVMLAVIVAAGGEAWAGLSGDFCATTLLVLAGVIAAGVVLDRVLLSHADRHRY